MVILESALRILSGNRQSASLLPTFDTQEYGVVDPYPLFIPINSSRLNLLKGTSMHVGSNEGLIEIADGKLFLGENVNGGMVKQEQVTPTSLLLLANSDLNRYPLLSIEVHPFHIFYLEESLHRQEKTQERFPFYALKMRSYTGIPGLAFFQINEQDDPVFADGFVSRHIEEKVKWEVYDEMKELGLLDLGAKAKEHVIKSLTNEFLQEEASVLIRKLGLNREEDIERIKEIFSKYFIVEFRTN